MQEENEFTFLCTELPNKCFSFFADIKNQEKFCDITLTVGVERISAHRIILAAAIPFFRDILSTEQQEITMPDVNPTVFQCLINYAYNCKLKINMENVRDLLSAACLLRMEEVLDACCDFLAENLRPDNVLNFKEFVDDLNYPVLVEIIDQCITENFMEISGTEKFLDLPFNYTKEIIAKDELCVDSEEKALDAVLNWVKASPDHRKENLPELLREVRMPLINHLYLTDILEREELIRTSLPIRDLIDEARNYNWYPERRKEICSFVTEPRQLVKTSCVNDGKQCIYMLTSEMDYTVQEFSITEKKWLTKKKQLFYWGNCCTAAVLNRKMYYFNGGHIVEYDTVTNKYHAFLYQAINRVYMSATSFKNAIYVCGGKAGAEVSNVVEIFDPEKYKLSQVSSLRTARCKLQTVTLGEHIFALGGRDNMRVHNSVERYPSVTGKWTTMAPMLTPRHSFGAAVLNGKIYVCGGCTDIATVKCSATAEVYDPIRNKWHYISSMSKARCDFFLVSFQGKLYALDGNNNNGERLLTSEVYNPENDKWSSGPSVDSGIFVSCAVVM